MSRLRSLWLKLLLGYVLVAVVAVGLVAILANRSTTHQFQLYVSQGKQARAQRLAPEFAAYLGQTGSWAGVAEWMVSLGLGNRQGRGRGAGTIGQERLILTDGAGRVVADSQDEWVGRQLSAAELALGAPIELAGQVVGTLLIPVDPGTYASLESEFLSQVNRSLLWAGLAAGAVAVALGLPLARQLTAPLRELTRAVHSLAQHKFGAPTQAAVPQVPIRSQDEIGELSLAFNQMARSLAEQETLRRNLMADIAHELRTPLSVLRSDLEALLDGVYEPTPQALASLQEETLLLSRLVEDLRALAQAEAGQLRLKRQSTELGELLRGVVAGLTLQAESLGLTLALEPLPELPLLEIDPQRIRQVLANLTSNALRHAAAGPQQVGAGRVVISAARLPEQVQVTVADNGPGIDPADLPNVFDRFWQGDQTRAATGDSGLGLTIARQLVRAHGGEIWAESAPGQGATFRFTLPIAPDGSNPEKATGNCVPDGGATGLNGGR